MSSGELILLFAIIFLLVQLSRRDSTSAEEQKANRDTISAIEERLETMERMLSQIQERLDDLPMSHEAKDARRFDTAIPITLADVRKWTEGEKMHLISKSYYYPHEEPVFHDFEYRHEQIDNATQGMFGYEVHGFWRSAPVDEWEPHSFMAKDDECTTSSCAGTIRRLS